MRLTVRSTVRIEEYIETVSASILFQFSRVPLHKCKFFKAYKDYHFSGKISLRQTEKKSHPLQQLPNVKFLLQILNNYSPGSKNSTYFFELKDKKTPIKPKTLRFILGGCWIVSEVT